MAQNDWRKIKKARQRLVLCRLMIDMMRTVHGAYAPASEHFGTRLETFFIALCVTLVFAHDGHVTQIRETYGAIWNNWFPKSGKTPAEAPGFERHNNTFDPRTGNGGVTIWIPIRA